MSSENPFKFTIQLPQYDIVTDKYYGMATIKMTAPAYVSGFRVEKSLTSEGQIRLAKAELKIKMIEALINGEWEIE